MDSLGFRDLVGRVMTDQDFLEELVHDPATTLADYVLSDDERALVIQALSRVGQAPTAERARAAKAVLMKRWAM